ncbi:hypothetical protein [Haloimpatiens massiliensis]|uniref:hypothetical protein n=1 Tax=Haloimpatiens massiliensis TaxID=1658110 RepID=UPI000C815590|nr:hypothetical protein [Haloimpatiens massiliensis]
MYEITIRIPTKRVGVINKIRNILKSSYETSNIKGRGTVEEIQTCKAGSMKEIGITFEITET